MAPRRKRNRKWDARYECADNERKLGPVSSDFRHSYQFLIFLFASLPFLSPIFLLSPCSLPSWYYFSHKISLHFSRPFHPLHPPLNISDCNELRSYFDAHLALHLRRPRMAGILLVDGPRRSQRFVEGSNSRRRRRRHGSSSTGANAYQLHQRFVVLSRFHGRLSQVEVCKSVFACDGVVSLVAMPAG